VVSTDARSSLDRPGFLAHRRGVDRKASCRCGSGRQYRNCCYSQDRAGEEARRAARSGLEQIESVVRVLLPLVESRGEHKVACKAGCNACCAQFVRASLPEALLIADWLRLPENAAVRARFEEKLPAWREAAQPETGELTQLMAAEAGGPQEGPAWERFRELEARYVRKRNFCPFNHQGNCEIYPIRPGICRAYNVIDTAEYCVPDAGGSPAVLSHPRLDEALRQAAALGAEGARRLGKEEHPLPLPEAVAWAVEAR